MEIEHMKEFIILGNFLKFSHAAEEMFISQSTLSRHIAALEKELGFSLVRRTTHSVELTPAGEMTMESFRTIASHYDALLSKLNYLGEGYHGKLSVGSLHCASDRYMTSFIREFSEVCPDVDIRLFHYDSSEMHEVILSGQIEAGLTLHIGEIDNKDLDYTVICRERLYAAVPCEHRLAAREVVDFSDLEGEPLVLFKHDTYYNNDMEALLKENGIKMGKRVYCIHLDMVTSCMKKYNAVAFLTDHTRDQTRRDIVYRRIRNDPFTDKIVMLYRKDNTNPTLKLFLNTIKHHRAGLERL